MKRGPDYNLVGEHRRAGTLTTVSTSRKGHAVGQARQAGLETRTHPGEAVPCRCCVCKVCRRAGVRPSRLSGRFGSDGEYALTKAAVSQFEAHHVLTTG